MHVEQLRILDGIDGAVNGGLGLGPLRHLVLLVVGQQEVEQLLSVEAPVLQGDVEVTDRQTVIPL